MNPADFGVEDLVADQSFQAYCLKTNPAAIAKWEAYRKQFPQQESVVREAQEIALMLHLQLSETEIEAEKDKFFQILEEKNQQSSASMQRRRFLRIAAVAASLALLLGVFLFFRPATPLLTHQSGDSLKQLVLPDGSTVFLDKNATLKYAESWKAKEDRQLWLDGKAFFEVSKTPQQGGKKFIIHTALGEVQVLGTSFVLDSRMESFEVVLETGKLSFSDIKNESTFIQPGERLFLKAGKISLEKTNGKNYSMWKEKEIRFKNTSIASIVDNLKASYQLDLEVRNNGLLDRKITATIPVNDLNLLFEALSEIYDITIVKEGQKIILK